MLKYYKLHTEVKDPQFATDGSACFDICAYLDKPVTVYRMNNHKEQRSPETVQWSDIEELQLSIAPADRVLVPTGLFVDLFFVCGYTFGRQLQDCQDMHIYQNKQNRLLRI